MEAVDSRSEDDTAAFSGVELTGRVSLLKPLSCRAVVIGELLRQAATVRKD